MATNLKIVIAFSAIALAAARQSNGRDANGMGGSLGVANDTTQADKFKQATDRSSAFYKLKAHAAKIAKKNEKATNNEQPEGVSDRVLEEWENLWGRLGVDDNCKHFAEAFQSPFAALTTLVSRQHRAMNEFRAEFSALKATTADLRGQLYLRTDLLDMMTESGASENDAVELLGSGRLAALRTRRAEFDREIGSMEEKALDAKVKDYLGNMWAHRADYAMVEQIFARLRGEDHATQELILFEFWASFDAPLADDPTFVKLGQEIVKKELGRSGNWSGGARGEMANILGHIRDPNSAEALVKALGDSDIKCRARAAEALMDIRGSEAQVRGLDMALQVDTGFGRVGLAQALTESLGVVDVEMLLEIFGRLQNDKDDAVKDVAKEFLNTHQAGAGRAALAVGGRNTCAIRDDGELRCWGERQCDEEWPLEVAETGRWISIAVGPHHTCAIRTDGKLFCWGDCPSRSCNFPMVAGGRWSSVATGQAHTCGITADGELRCWGQDEYGQCQVPMLAGGWTSVVAGNRHTCGIRADGELVCWGKGCWYGCDRGGDRYAYQAPRESWRWSFLMAAGVLTCGIRVDGELHCWDYTASDLGPPVKAASQWRWSAVAMERDSSHFCGITVDGELRCWGENREIPEVAGRWSAVAGGDSQTCGINENTLLCWGRGAVSRRFL